MLLGAVPFGLIYGIAAVTAGIPGPLAQAMSMLVFAGSAQFVVAQLVAASVPGVLIVLTIFVVNLRHALYSASVAPHVRQSSRWWRSLLAYLLTDEAYAVSIAHFHQHPQRPHKRWYLLGAGLLLWASWQISTAVGVVLGARIPQEWPLDFALPLTFIALVVPMLKGRSSILAAIAAGATSVLAVGLPYKLGLLVAVVAGVCAGLALDRLKEPVDARDRQGAAP